jgi:flavodoxin
VFQTVGIQMKSLVVYYSLTGNTKMISEKIAASAGSEILEIVPIKEYQKEGASKYIWGGYEAKMKKEPELNPINIDLNKYNLIFLGSPVWAWTLSPPVRSFLKKNTLTNKKFALFMTAGGDGIKGMDRFKSEVISTLGDVIIGTALFQDPLVKNQDEQVKKAIDWAKLMITN